MMLVGPTGGGKTMNYRLLQRSMTELCKAGDTRYEHVETHILNPKAITQAQLYGAFDEVTREWSDGVASECVRVAVASGKDGCPNSHWVIFDGPVDALWIESMNTVLDDNKKLCLVSGEIIALTPPMRMIFEVEDLSVASPATVSRCGMVYMEPQGLGYEPFIKSWLMYRLPPGFEQKEKDDKVVKNTLERMLNALLPLIFVVRKKTKEVQASVDNNLLSSLLRLLDCFFAQYFPTEAKTATPEEIEFLEPLIAPLVIFCALWTLGASCDFQSRAIVETKVREIMAEQGVELPIPEEETLYDYRFNFAVLGAKSDDPDAPVDPVTEPGKWVDWMRTIPDFSPPKNATFESMVVPTVDSVRLSYVFDRLMRNKSHVLIPGSTGTGKTCYIAQWLQKDKPDNYTSVNINFSAQTHVNQLQDNLDSRMEKRRRGVFGPPAGKQIAIFIDDLNMPQKEFYGAQPPIELVRQWMDHGGWYNRKELVFNQVIDILFICAEGPPGGGRTFVTNRLLRHFNFIVAVDCAEKSVRHIFNSIFTFFLGAFEDDIKKLQAGLMTTCYTIYNRIGLELLPTPTKPHYMFNLRDIWKVVQGICSLSPKKIFEPVTVFRATAHENIRVFGDRLINAADQKWLKDVLDKEIVESLGSTPEAVFEHERLVFTHFMDTSGGDVKFFVEAPDIKKVITSLEGYLEDYNGMFALQMPLVLFSDAAEHVSRVVRVLNSRGGNALLLGVGGSGRQSLSRLASFVLEYECFQIEVAKGYGMNEFREDLRTCLLKCGVENKITTFLFCDAQIVKEEMVESLNNVLNSGDVPNLYKTEDFDVITPACRPLCTQAGLQPTKSNIFSMYVGRVKNNVHVVLAFSPVGSAFRNRLRMFPSLVNCCTIDWFHPWPADALYSVGMQQLSLEDLQLPNQEGIVMCFRTMHKSCEKVSKLYLEENKRPTYVTPTSFLELITSFKLVLKQVRNEVGTLRGRLQKGLDALGQAEWAVANMEKELQILQPQLAKTKA